MKTKNPSEITLARRAVDNAILASARMISDKLAEKVKPTNIAVWGMNLPCLYYVLEILSTHEMAGRRELTPEGVRRIGLIIERYRPDMLGGYAPWLDILKSMIEKNKV